MTYVDVGIGITFQVTPWVPLRSFRQFLFDTTGESDGQLRWREYPMPSIPATYPPQY